MIQLNNQLCDVSTMVIDNTLYKPLLIFFKTASMSTSVNDTHYFNVYAVGEPGLASCFCSSVLKENFCSNNCHRFLQA